jgi:uncharacterized repeat protein (TIGR03837 family)
MPDMTAPCPASPSLRWDIFCRVIDNYGDIGVCWRLCADLAQRGHQVRLWVDDASALDWMAPGARQGQWPGVQVLDWQQSSNTPWLHTLPRSDVWVEAFGCEIAPEFIAAHAHSTGASGTNGTPFPVWINLEYLSAEAWVERCHGLPSPILHGPAQGQSKYFFYPGFTPSTGGLLREPGLLERRQAFDTAARRQWFAQHGIPWQGERVVSLFCYEPASLAATLQSLGREPSPTLLLITPGRASEAVRQVPPAMLAHSTLRLHFLPPLSQTDFDHLLWASDFNAVRGEDSVVRALWAGQPFAWHIYPQEDAAHHNKLQAFLQQLQAPKAVQAFHASWNGITPQPVRIHGCITRNHAWKAALDTARSTLQAQHDLTSQLVEFVMKKR